MSRTVFAVILLAGVATASFAQTVTVPETGQDLYQQWQSWQRFGNNPGASSEVGTMNAMSYAGFVFAVVEILADGLVQAPIRLPSSYQMGQMMYVTGDYLAAHPEKWSYSADYLVQ